ncbi:MAG TPA: hypothetical protein VF164_03420 [Trueperaceae bacterium]
MRTRRSAALALFVSLLAVLAACAPTTLPGADDAAVAELERTAQVIYHRMELGRLESGTYTTNVLVDLQLPEGAKWTLQEFANDGSTYRLSLTSSRVEGAQWQVSPSGVRRVS